MDIVKMEPSEIIFVTLTVVLAATAILLNILVLSVIVAAEKITRNVVCLLFLCIAHLELSLLMIIHRLMEIGISTDSTYNMLLTESYNSTTSSGLDTTNCIGIVLVESLEKGAILWGIASITSLTLNQYLYIERPFWYGNNVTSRGLVLASALSGAISHLIGMVPLMTGTLEREVCKDEDVLEERGFYLAFGIIIILLFIIIVGLCVRMIVLAEGHRKKILEHNTLKTSRADSMRFLIILIVTYLISNIAPVICGLTDAYSESVMIPHMKVNILHLLAPISYAILYGSRTPAGFLKSVKLAICCCVPVKQDDPELQISDIVRLAMMRLGHVMMKIDEQAAIKRHNSYLQRRSRIISTMTFRKPSQKEHQTLRPYKSFNPTSHASSNEDAANENKTLSRTISLDLKAVECNRVHRKGSRMFSWLPGYGSTKATLTLSQTPKEVPTDVEAAGVMLTALTTSKKLSAIAEKSESVVDYHTEDDTSSTETENNVRQDANRENTTRSSSLITDSSGSIENKVDDND